ncbi:MAG: hypothetical protein KDC09_10410 [Bacteroidales bacterium]|nr:hypothetical protein [Bacteroidales bacterium]
MANNNSNIYRIVFALIWAILFIISIFYHKELYNSYWIFGYGILLPVILIQIVLIFLNFKRNKHSFVITVISTIIGLGIVLVRDSEVFKSKVLFKAHLDGDINGLTLKFRSDETFEMISSTFMGHEESYSGNYKLEDDKIIFLDRPYDNDFVPDTLQILNDKLILNYYLNGEPDTSFGNFFQIIENHFP